MILAVPYFATSVSAAVPAICGTEVAVFAELRLAYSVAAAIPTVLWTTVAVLIRIALIIRTGRWNRAIHSTSTRAFAVLDVAVAISTAETAVGRARVAVLAELWLARFVPAALPAIPRTIAAVLICTALTVGTRWWNFAIGRASLVALPVHQLALPISTTETAVRQAGIAVFTELRLACFVPAVLPAIPRAGIAVLICTTIRVRTRR